MLKGLDLKKFKVICPLINFQIQWRLLIGYSNLTPEEKIALIKDRRKQIIKGIELFDGIKIRIVNKEDIEDLKSSLIPSPKVLLAHISNRTYLLEKDLIVKKDHEFETDKLMRKTVLALNLFKEAHVHGDDVFNFQEFQKRLLITGWSRERPLPANEMMGSRYDLNFEEIPKLKKLIKKIQTINFEKRKSLHLACKRFQRIYSEYDIEDQLIDSMIAFEALFLKGEKKGQSGRIISIACSTLLGKNDQEREEIKNTLNRAYAMRNRIVHGGEYKEDLCSFEVIEKISEYLRASINRFLD